jgi:uncharacterized cupredoxin-like copper-binding protein
VVVWVLGVVAVACGGGSNDEATDAGGIASPSLSPSATFDGTVSVELRELTVTPNTSTVPAGEVTFAVENVGQFTHEFIVARLDPGTTELPTRFNGAVRENGKGFEIVGRVPMQLHSEQSADLALDLASGNYVLFCNVVVGGGTAGPIESHYARGMWTSFTVT